MNRQGKKYDVFISYRRDGGLELARALNLQLDRLGVKCFFDIEEIQTGKFNAKIYEAIADSRYFIFILTPHALDRCVNKGDWVRNELECAMNLGMEPILVTWKDSVPDFAERLPVKLKDLANHQVSFIDRDTAFNATVRQLMECRLPDVETVSEQKRREAEETFIKKARRFKNNDNVIDSQERAMLVAFAKEAGIDAVRREFLIEQVESESKAQSQSDSQDESTKDGKVESFGASDVVGIIACLALLCGIGWLLWLLAKWCWNNIGFVGHWVWLIVKWPLYFVGIMIGIMIAWEQLKAMFKGDGFAWLLFVTELVVCFVFFF